MSIDAAISELSDYADNLGEPLHPFVMGRLRRLMLRETRRAQGQTLGYVAMRSGHEFVSKYAMTKSAASADARHWKCRLTRVVAVSTTKRARP